MSPSTPYWAAVGILVLLRRLKLITTERQVSALRLLYQEYMDAKLQGTPEALFARKKSVA